MKTRNRTKNTERDPLPVGSRVLDSAELETSALFVLGPFYIGDTSDDEMTHHREATARTNTGHNWPDENDFWICDSKVQDENLVEGASY